jgi:tetratricopeptide (TPR) repeat protein
MRVGLLFVVLMSAAVLTAQDGPMPAPTRTPPKPKSSTTSSVPPRSDDQPAESSSKDTMIDISPPKGDSVSHPNSGVADDVLEMHPYNPMKAMKDVEVGDYHYKRKNYRAAISRYQEALEYKPHDAVATFALAQSLEKVGDDNGAREAYEDYLKTLPNGPEAARCRKALEHLSKSAKDASK